MDSRRIHIRVHGANARDLGALHRWLSREDWYARATAEHGLRIAYREVDGTEREAAPGGPPMGGLITELVLVLTSAAAAPIFDDLYTRAKAAVGAWADNSGVQTPQVEPEGPQAGEGEGAALPARGANGADHPLPSVPQAADPGGGQPGRTDTRACLDGGDDGEAR